MSKKKAKLRFSKEQLVKSARYAEKQDILMAVLAEDCLYDYDEADELIKNFQEKRV